MQQGIPLWPPKRISLGVVFLTRVRSITFPSFPKDVYSPGFNFFPLFHGLGSLSLSLSGNKKEEKILFFCSLSHCKNYKVIYYLLSEDLPLFPCPGFFLLLSLLLLSLSDLISPPSFDESFCFERIMTITGHDPRREVLLRKPPLKMRTGVFFLRRRTSRCSEPQERMKKGGEGFLPWFPKFYVELYVGLLFFIFYFVWSIYFFSFPEVLCEIKAPYVENYYTFRTISLNKRLV